jgi:hypothetical protein
MRKELKTARNEVYNNKNSMKKLNTYKWAVLMALVTFTFACKKGGDQPSVDDNVLNYEIEIKPPTRDYILGAFYTNFGSGFNANIKEVPTIGKYGYPNALPTTIPTSALNVMAEQITMAKKAKLDYFVFNVRSANLDFNNYRSDSITISTFLNAPNTKDMKFALSYNLNTTSLGISNTIAIETLPAKLESFYKDFQRMGNDPSSYFKKENYMKVNGKTLLIINNAQNLNANDCPAVYKEMRKRMSLLGFELYIVGMQDRWSPPQRFYYRFQNCVDAMYEYNMIDTRDYDRYFLFLQNVDQGWKYWKSTLQSMNIEFIPSISPAFNNLIQNPASRNPNFLRNDGGMFYRKFCNVAKDNASASGLIFIDSWNNYNLDTQIESTQAYGDLYLDITRQEFKLN